MSADAGEGGDGGGGGGAPPPPRRPLCSRQVVEHARAEPRRPATAGRRESGGNL